MLPPPELSEKFPCPKGNDCGAVADHTRIRARQDAGRGPLPRSGFCRFQSCENFPATRIARRNVDGDLAVFGRIDVHRRIDATRSDIDAADGDRIPCGAEIRVPFAGQGGLGDRCAGTIERQGQSTGGGSRHGG